MVGDVGLEVSILHEGENDEGHAIIDCDGAQRENVLVSEVHHDRRLFQKGHSHRDVRFFF